MSKKKMEISGHVFAEVNDILYQKFSQICNMDIEEWLKLHIICDFGINVKNKGDIDELQTRLSFLYYEDINEWISEKMREYIKEYEYSQKKENKVLCYGFKDIENERFVNSKKLTDEFISRFIKSKSIMFRYERNYMKKVDNQGRIPDIIAVIIFSIEYPMKDYGMYLRNDEKETIKECLKGTEYESLFS